MKYKEILKTLEIIEGSLDDAFYSLPEYNANTDSRDYIDSARSELYCLKEDIEKKVKKSEKKTWLYHYFFVRSSKKWEKYNEFKWIFNRKWQTYWGCRYS